MQVTHQDKKPQDITRVGFIPTTPFFFLLKNTYRLIACGLLSNKIYCLGGITEIEGSSDNSINVLDIVAYSGSTADELSDKWQHLSSNVDGHNIQIIQHSQRMVLPDGKSMLLSGGAISAYDPSTPSTVVYHSESNSWTTYPEYTELNFGRRQM